MGCVHVLCKCVCIDAAALLGSAAPYHLNVVDPRCDEEGGSLLRMPHKVCGTAAVPSNLPRLGPAVRLVNYVDMLANVLSKLRRRSCGPHSHQRPSLCFMKVALSSSGEPTTKSQCLRSTTCHEKFVPAQGRTFCDESSHAGGSSG